METTLAIVESKKTRRILGVEFFCGSAQEAVNIMRAGGLLVAPAAPSLRELPNNPSYRDALLNADIVLPDSSFMVLIWNYLQQEQVVRLSGLEYLRELLIEPDVRSPGNTLWVFASRRSAQHNLTWLQDEGIEVPPSCVYLAPIYRAGVEDEVLRDVIDKLRPKHVIVTIGGGTQERLGLYLRRQLEYRPAIHCIGAAIAFLSGDQVHIPVWADKVYLGWLFRALSDPKLYFPRYWHARKLLSLLLRYREKMPRASRFRRLSRTKQQGT